jgi:HTH-type transcriptional regulator, cell division transcriptional repressor
MNSIPERYKRARLAAGLTQQAVARHFGLDKASVWRWEHGRTSPSVEQLNESAELFDVSPIWLVHGVGRTPALPGEAAASPPAETSPADKGAA